MTILQTKNLKKHYGAGDTLVKALDGVNLSVENGEFVAIVGTSGSGKSTLLHMLGGLDRPTSGSVIMDGQDIFSLKDEALTIFRRRKIGFVFQAYNLVQVLSVYENIVLSPVIFSRLNGIPVDTVSASPWIFVGAGLFSLLTVFLSCARPARMAAKVSPVEAVRYTEGGRSKRAKKKGRTNFSLFHMAAANLGRSRGKTVVTILSLTLAVVLLQMTAVFTNGFDMNKYLQDKAACDFILAGGGYFENNVFTWDTGSNVLPQEVIDEVSSQVPVSQGGRILGQLDAIQEFCPEDWYQKQLLHWGNSQETVEDLLDHAIRTEDGRVMDRVLTYGMDPFALDTLTVVEGDLSSLYQPALISFFHRLQTVQHPLDLLRGNPLKQRRRRQGYSLHGPLLLFRPSKEGISSMIADFPRSCQGDRL